MSPESRFKKPSKKVYKAVRRAIKKAEHPTTHVFIAGRRSGVRGAHMVMYVDRAGIWEYHGEWYFTEKPKKKEVHWAMQVMTKIGRDL